MQKQEHFSSVELDGLDATMTLEGSDKGETVVVEAADADGLLPPPPPPRSGSLLLWVAACVGDQGIKPVNRVVRRLDRRFFFEEFC